METSRVVKAISRVEMVFRHAVRPKAVLYTVMLHVTGIGRSCNPFKAVHHEKFALKALLRDSGISIFNFIGHNRYVLKKRT